MNPSLQKQLPERRAAVSGLGRLKPFEAAAELRSIARAVLHIGDPLRIDPETFCIQKDEIARRLLVMASSVERTA
jgi:hypothetical protein